MGEGVDCARPVPVGKAKTATQAGPARLAVVDCIGRWSRNMNRLLVVALAPALLLAGGDKRKNAEGSSQVEVIELAARRTTEKTVELDGRVRNCGGSTLHKVVLRFKVLAPGNEVVATQLGSLDEAALEPGEEAEFHWKMREHARAVAILVEATARNMEIGVAKSGPYPIE